MGNCTLYAVVHGLDRVHPVFWQLHRSDWHYSILPIWRLFGHQPRLRSEDLATWRRSLTQRSRSRHLSHWRSIKPTGSTVAAQLQAGADLADQRSGSSRTGRGPRPRHSRRETQSAAKPPSRCASKPGTQGRCVAAHRCAKPLIASGGKTMVDPMNSLAFVVHANRGRNGFQRRSCRRFRVTKSLGRVALKVAGLPDPTAVEYAP